MYNKNFILNTDAYKQTHYRMLPKKLTNQFSYIESRGVSDKGVPPEVLFFGLQIYLNKLSRVRITQENIDEADEFTKKVFGQEVLNKSGWKKIVEQYGGKIPVTISAVPEGTLVPSRNVLVTVENEDPELGWLINHIETSLLRAVWYPTTVATTSFGIKRLILRWAAKTGGNLSIPFHLNDFGARGVSSEESAEIGGAAHLVNFLGSDTLEGIKCIMENYDSDVCGHSVPASEHSATIVYGKENESKAYEHMLTEFPNGIISIVSDSYDLYDAVKNIFGKELRHLIYNRNGKLVVRPDSGYPPLVTVQVIKLLAESFGYTINAEGYKVLDSKVGVIYGDFISYGMVDDILSAVADAGFSTDNVVFGMGGALLQQVNRDTYKFAMKTSAAKVDGKWIDVSKNPSTDHGKKSKSGKLMLISNNGNFETIRYNDLYRNENLLIPVYKNGEVIKKYSFKEIRERSNKFL